MMFLARGALAPARKIELKFADVLCDLPPAPKTFCYYGHVDQPWGMLANNHLGDCVVAGAAHETMLLNAMAGRKVVFNDDAVTTDYRAMQGNPPWPFNDRGLDMEKAADYRRRIGIHDAIWTLHKVDAYCDLDNDTDKLIDAVNLLGAAGVGLNLPGNAESMWAEMQPWTDTSQPPSGEGHYVCAVGRNSAGLILLVTWGRLHAASVQFLQKYWMCFIAYLSREQLNNKGLSPAQYDDARLNSFLVSLGGTNGT
jgi:hypothetical protein